MGSVGTTRLRQPLRIYSMADLPGVSLPNLTAAVPNTSTDPSVAMTMLRLKQMQIQMPQMQNEATQAQQQFNDQQAIRTSIANNTKADPVTGQPVMDQGGMMKDLINNPTALLAFKNQQAEMAIKQQQAMKDQLSNIQAQTTLTGAIAGSVLSGDSQQSYDWGKQKAQAAGMDVSHLPDQWGPEAKQQVQLLFDEGQNAHDQIQTHLDTAKLNQEVGHQANESIMALHGQYMADDQTKEFQRIATAASQINTAYQQTQANVQKKATAEEQGVSDMGLVTGAIKMENPLISPRQGTMLSLEDSRSITSDIAAAWNKVASGATLSQAQRDSIKDFASRRMEDSRVAQANTDAIYQKTAIGLGLPTKDTYFDNSNILSNTAVTQNPFNSSKPKPNIALSQPDISALPNGGQPAPATAPTGSSRWVSQAKFNSLAPEVQANLKAHGVEVR